MLKVGTPSRRKAPFFKRGWKGVIRVHLHDEAPRIGCGVRRVYATVGNRTVKLTNLTTGRSSRIPRDLFETIAFREDIDAQVQA